MKGRRLAHYEITAHLGSGGMGEVYQATDTKLGRDVALKFLPQAFTHDLSRTARFEREAKALASLNHPHIAAIHGLEELDGQRFLVMELVPGQTLHERIAGRPMPLDEALGIARQIAEALETAHDRGIVHRDLKPANVKITPDGQVKVLDFGLAKLAAGEADGADVRPANLTDSPTLVVPSTQVGVILGTAAYMAPEQAKGRPVDRRADIFAFGCVLYEMVTGRRAFDGEDVPDILSRILQREPDWTRVPPDVPPAVRRLMRLCLEKDPRKRRQSAGDVRIDLEQALAREEAVATAPAAPQGRSRAVRAGLMAAAIAVVGALGIPAAIHLRERPAPVMRLQLLTPPTLDAAHFALSPDGRYIVFVASESSTDTQRLYLRALDDEAAQPITGTGGARLPFWSPDSRSVAFFAAERLFRIDITGGRAQPLAPAANPQGGTWGEDGTILFSPNTVSPLLSVPASGGDVVAVTTLDSPRQQNHRRPSFLPGSRRFLFYAGGEPDVSGIYLGSLDGGAPTRLTAAPSAGAYLVPDHVVFVQGGALVARRLDAVRGELTGDPVTLAASVGAAAFSVSATGVVAHRAISDAPVRFTWIDSAGGVVKKERDGFNAPDLSPDGRYLAYDGFVEGNRDVWIADLIRGGRTPFTRHSAVDGFPVWSPDGSQVVFESQRNGTFDLWIKPFSGARAEELLLDAGANEWPLDWSRDGRFILYRKTDSNYASSDLWALPMIGDTRTPIAVANTAFEERIGEFSPDGRWVAYETDESGRSEIVVQAFPEPGGRVFVSTAGGAAPRWSADGTQIYYVAPDGTMMAVAAAVAGFTFTPGTPTPLFLTHIVAQPFTFAYTVSPDGRFLVNNREFDDASNSPINLILNWKP